MTRLVIAFDGSPPARAAVEHAAALLPGAETAVVAVAEGLGTLADGSSLARAGISDEVARTAVDRLREQALAEARTLAEEGSALAAAAGLAATAVVTETSGSVRDAIAHAAGEHGAHAIACGTRGHGRISRAILGSVSSGLVQHAGLPVLVVPAEAEGGDGPLVIGFDDSEEAARAVAAAGPLLLGRPALVVHVWRSQIRHTITGGALLNAPLDEIRDIARDIDELLEDSAKDVAARGADAASAAGLEATAETVESGGPASEALLDAADRHGAPALIVGRGGRGAMGAAVLGSVSASLLHAATRPVLVGG